jgi:type IV pilus assembly protein PilV
MAARKSCPRPPRALPARPLRDRAQPSRRAAVAGHSMIEVLVSLVILLLGLMGLLGLQARAQTAEMESYQRAQAIVLLQDIADRMNANRTDAWALAYHQAAVGGLGALADCGGKTGAALDICQWGNMLKGAAEVSGSGTCSSAGSANCVGAMIGARGCILYDAATELTDSAGTVVAGTGIYTISIAWQGLAPTVAPASTLTCGYGSYNGDSKRRIVTSTVRIAALGAS